MMKLRTLSRRAGLAVLGLSLLPAVGWAEEKQPTDRIGDYRVEGIDVVQGRVFKKGLRHEFSFLGGLIPNSTFLRYELLEAKYTFHFREGLGLEAFYAHAFHQNKGILTDLANIPCPSPSSDLDGNGVADSTEGKNCGVKLDPPPDPLTDAAFLNVIWSPIYGKFAIFSKKIFHFDVYLLGGVGWWHTDKSASTLNVNRATNHVAFDVGLGMKLFLNQWASVLVDFRNFTVKESAPFNSISNNMLISLGMSVFLPPHPVTD